MSTTLCFGEIGPLETYSNTFVVREAYLNDAAFVENFGLSKVSFIPSQICAAETKASQSSGGVQRKTLYNGAHLGVLQVDTE